MARQVYDNSMVAHIWANQSQESARSNNGQFYFSGPRLYSYGSHFVAGLMVTDKQGKRHALLNGRGYSMTTGRHMREARRAVAYRYVELPDLTEFDGDVRQAAFREEQAAKNKAIRAAIMRQARLGLAGDNLATVCGLYGLGQSAGAIAREAAKANAKAKQEAAKKQAARQLREAQYYAGLTDSAFAEAIKQAMDCYSVARISNLATELFRLHRDTKAKLGKRAAAKLAARIKIARNAKGQWERVHNRAQWRGAMKRQIAIIRRANEATGERAADYSDATKWELRELSHALGYVLAYLPADKRGLAETRAGLMATRIAEIEKREAAEKFEREAQARADWLAGAGNSYWRGSDERGGALMRIIGDELQTSWGARVPLDHAVRAFRFIKRCKESGAAWQRNGRTIRVGHFHVDSISPSGDFVAGCHRFNWPEIERVARIAGVFEAASDDSALESSH